MKRPPTSPSSAAALLNQGARVVSDPARPELGLLLQAERALPAGQLVIREKAPLLHVLGGAGKYRSLPESACAKADAVREAGLFVPDAGDSILARVRGEAPAGETDAGLFLRGVLHFNSFAAGPGGNDQVVFGMLARANHSCRPNCIVDGDEGTLRTISTVETGEALTISYLDEAALLWRRDRRKAELSRRWGFVCGCARCASVADDVRRFQVCPSPGCEGDLIVQAASSADKSVAQAPLPLSCSKCSATVGTTEAATLLAAEAFAEGCLQKVQEGRLEEEEEGQELMKCYKFASKHKMHAVALELAHDFEYPDAVPAKKAVLEGLRVVFSDMPNELSSKLHRELAELVAARGHPQDAEHHFHEAAKMACMLDGRSSPAEVMQEWEKEKKEKARMWHSSAAAQGGGQPAAMATPDLDLDLGPPAVPAVANPTTSFGQGRSGNAQPLERQSESGDGARQPAGVASSPEVVLQGSGDRMISTAVASSVVVAAAAALLFSVFLRAKRGSNGIQ